jgi:hypothetical protein
MSKIVTDNKMCFYFKKRHDMSKNVTDNKMCFYFKKGTISLKCY